MKQIKTEDAVGQILCNDITQIVRGVIKDAKFRKGHVITEEDIPVLLSLGKENIYVWENDDKKLHENDAAEILRRLCQGAGLEPTAVKEGKIELKAAYDGVIHIDEDKLNAVNEIDEICIATVSNHIPVRRGKSVAGMRVIPLVIDKSKMDVVKDFLQIHAKKLNIYKSELYYLFKQDNDEKIIKDIEFIYYYLLFRDGKTTNEVYDSYPNCLYNDLTIQNKNIYKLFEKN